MWHLPLFRPLPRLALAGLSLLGAIGCACAADGVNPADVHVSRNGDSFTVDLVMHASVPPAQAFEVLTDFDHMASFVPNLRASQVLSRQGAVLKVSQQGVAQFGPVSRSFESVREVRLIPPSEIRVHGLSGSVKRMDSLMQLQPEPGGTRLQYHAEVDPGSWMPPLVGPALVQHETAEQFSAMLDEMARRH
jgi:carbon monoxide dehydrogenase subunit G